MIILLMEVLSSSLWKKYLAICLLNNYNGSSSSSSSSSRVGVAVAVAQ